MSRAALAILLSAVLLALAAAARLLAGAEPWTLALPDAPVVWELRGLRLAMGVGVGASLALAGVLLQSLLRNPLASPEILGLSAGAGLGVMAASYAAYRATGALFVYGGNVAPATLGAFAALALVYALSQRRGLLDPLTLVLTGVVVGIVAGAGTLLFQSLLPDRGQSTVIWFLGTLNDNASWGHVLGVLGGSAAAVAAAAALGPAMDAASLSEDEARAVGVRLGALRAGQFLAAGLLTAGSVSLAGPIGFVGLVCPHAVRLIAGPGHRTLAVAAPLLGAALVVGADAGVRLVDLGGGRLPLGVLTALIGGPVFILLLRRSTLSA